MTNRLGRFQDYINRRLWEPEVAGATGLGREFLHIIVLACRGLVKNRPLLQDASLAYATILALIPLLALLFAILKSLGIQRLLAAHLMDRLAPGSHDFAEQIFAYIEGTQVTSLGVFGVVWLLAALTNYGEREMLIQVISEPKIEADILKTLWWGPLSREYTKRLFPQLFTERRVHIFSAIKKMFAENKPFELRILADECSPLATELDIVETINDTKILGIDALEIYIRKIKESYFLRFMNHVQEKISDHANRGEYELIARKSSSVESVYAKLFSRSHENEASPFLSAVDVVNSPIEYIPVSFPRLRTLFGGWTRNDVSSIGGKSGHNKTTWTIFDAIQSIKSGAADRIVYFAVDEPGEMVARRIIASEMNISLKAMRDKTVRLDPDEVKRAVEVGFQNKFIIVDDLFSRRSDVSTRRAGGPWLPHSEEMERNWGRNY